MKKILVIDDEKYLRSNLVLALGFEGYEARGAENGRQGVLAASEWLPDLIVCDVTMPDLDGFEVMTALRQDVQTAAIPVLLLSGRNEQRFIQNAMRLGAVAYIPKPYELEDLLDAIQKLLGQ
jgi:CheY-like chemotaxis protein